MQPGATLDRAARGWLLVGLLGLVATVLAGLWTGSLLAFGYTFPAGDWFQFGRLRPVHTRLAVHLWLLPCVLGVLRARLPVARPVRYQRFLPWVWAALQAIACGTIVLLGVAGPAYAEAPPFLDLAGAVLLVGAAVPILATLRKGVPGHEGTGLLYATEMLVWAVLLTVLLHAVLPFLDGTRAAALQRLWLADSIGLVVTPAAAAAAYLSLPALTGRPSRRPLLGRIGFYALAATYVLVGGRHALFGPQAEAVATLGWISSLAIAVPSVALAWNVLESVVRGRAPGPAAREASAWLFLGAALWIVLALQGALQSVPAVNAVFSKTDWVVGHAHLAFFGAVGALVIGSVQGVLAGGERPPRRTAALLRWAWVVAVAGMLWALTARSLREAAADLDGTPYATRFAEIQGMWHMRLSFGLLAAVGLLAWASVAFRTLLRTPDRAALPAEGSQKPVPLVGRAAWAVGLGVGSLALILGLTPAPEAASASASDAPGSGERIFLREGCTHCHTLAPRDLPFDRSLFGEPIPPERGPAQPGTRRIGPDLAHVGSRRTAAWLRAHLAAPQSTDEDTGHVGVAKTAMPSFGHLAPGDLDALVAWLASLR